MWTSVALHSQALQVEVWLQEEDEGPMAHADSSDAVEIAAAVAMPIQQGAGVLRPPAIVTEFMSGGSLRQALARRSDAIAGGLARCMIAMDAAKVFDGCLCAQPISVDWRGLALQSSWVCNV